MVYGALWQLRDVGLCLVAIWAPKSYRTRVILLATASWYAGQAIDEWYNGNLFTDGYWEYGLLAVLGVATFIHLKYHDPAGTKDHQAELDH